jgi:hypothetical protein
MYPIILIGFIGCKAARISRGVNVNFCLEDFADPTQPF